MAQFVELEHVDYSAYELCFQPVGVSLLQFRCMKATGCFEWVTHEAGKVLVDENEFNGEALLAGDGDADWKYMYWQLLSV